MVNKKILSVSQVNSYIKQLFDNDYVMKNIWIQGEISNCKIHSSGHVYFTLKDANSAISCVLFKGYKQNISCPLKDGIKVIARGAVSVYERSGQYQLYVKDLIEDGIGILYQRFETLKIKLEQQGLFNNDFKKRIPIYPRKVGIVTSDTGAAIRDIVNVAKRRNPYVQLVLYPSLVQGELAKYNIVKGIKYLDEIEDIDVILIGRGGGSIEDLWAFNEEMVATTIYQANTPIISAVGHETDFTISDFVADLRAPTPSAGAELAIPSINDINETIDKFAYKLNNFLNFKLDNNKNLIELYKARMEIFNPTRKVEQNIQYLIELQSRMDIHLDDQLKNAKNVVELLKMNLIRLSPVEKLKNGYAYLSDVDRKQVKSIDDISINDIVSIQLYDGQAEARILNIKKGKGF